MTEYHWSDEVLGAKLADEPAFNIEIDALTREANSNPDKHIILDFSHVNYLNSSNITKILKLHKAVIANHRVLTLCSVPENIRGVLRISGLDRKFSYAPDTRTAMDALRCESND